MSSEERLCCARNLLFWRADIYLNINLVESEHSFWLFSVILGEILKAHFWPPDTTTPLKKTYRRNFIELISSLSPELRTSFFDSSDCFEGGSARLFKSNDKATAVINAKVAY